MLRSQSLTLTRLLLIVGAGLVVLGGAVLWALPEIVRRVAVAQIPKRTGRAATIEGVELNLFTGRLAVKKFRLADRGGTEPFAEFERLDARISLPALLRSHIRLLEVALAAPSIRVVRTAPAEFNFSDLTEPSKEPEKPAPAPSRWTITVERLRISRGTVRADDRGVTPAAEWLIQDLGVEADGLTTRTGALPGRLTVHAKINEAVLDVSADPLRFEPSRIRAKLNLASFEMRHLNPYVYIPLGTPYLPKGGRLSLALTALVESDGDAVTKAVLSGTMSLEREALAQLGRPDPFLSVSRLAVEIKEADALRRSLTVASVAIEGLDLKARRDAKGVIDVLELLKPRASTAPPAARERAPAPVAAGPAPPARAPPGPPARRTLFPILQELARGFDQIRIERITLAPSTAAITDESVKPTTTLALTKLQARIDDLTWPVAGPAALTLTAGLPGGGTLDIKGPVIVQPFDVDLAFAVRDAPVEPYQAYIPVPARLSGRYSGDSRNRIALRDGQLVLTSKGHSWGEKVEIRTPGAERPAIRVERMDLVGIDLDWPKRAAVAKASFRRLRVDVEREADSSINLRRLFTASEAAATPAAPAAASAPAASPAPAPGPSPEGPKPKGLLETMQLAFKEVRLEDGFIRFLDRTTTPAFSQDLSRLELTLTDFGNRPGQRAKLVLQSVVGGDAGLDIRGEIGSLGSPPFIDLVGDLRRFKLSSVDAYATANIGWVINKGELEYKFRFKLDGDALTVSNEMVVGQLQVSPASGGDEVKRRIGMPLGLIVALIKDQKGDIRANIPVTGSLNDPKFDLKDTIWAAVKNVLVNVVTAPFKAISRLFSSGEKLEEPKVDAVTFAAGSSVLAPAMEEHLLRVADFIRRSPFVNLAMTPVSSLADAEALKNEAVTARLRDFQKEHGLDNAAAALAAYYKEKLPEVPLPPTAEEQLARLREREPAPDALLVTLGRRRVEATRERLLKIEGIPPGRLAEAATPPGAGPPAPVGEGRVEFGIVAGSP